MKTLYIDVYFLINFTVDILALYFAAALSRIPTSAPRLIISSALGALFASLIIFLPENEAAKLIFSAIALIAVAYIATKRIGMARRIKFLFSFLIFEALVGGAVYWLWEFLDTYLYDRLSGLAGGTVNRKTLLLAIILLLSIGVFKMLVTVFSANRSEGSVSIEIGFMGKSIRTEAFVDSGNLAIDPMDMRPVMLIKPSLAKRILPENVLELRDPDIIERDIRRRIRLIPITRGGETHVLVGVRADYIKILANGTSEEICVTVAVDREGGSYGGFEALMPASALDNAI